MSVVEAGLMVVVIAAIVCLVALFRGRREDTAEVIRALAELVRAFVPWRRR